jgi:ADP-heptose:LPS heptosyltransferase
MGADELLKLQGSRILVVHQGAVGDIILALPAVTVLRESLRPAWLEMLGHSWTLPLALRHPNADAIRDINGSEFVPLFQQDTPFPLNLTQYLAAFNAAFVFSRTTTLARNLHRAGIEKTFTLPSFPDERRHVSDHHLLSLQSVGIATRLMPPALPSITLREEERAQGEEFFLRQGWGLDEIVALHPGAGSRKKAWPPHRFAAIGQTLVAQGKKIVLIQGPADEAVVAEVHALLAGTPHLLVHDCPLTELAAFLNHVSLFIGNDSGISHLAAALGVPTLAIFGPTDPAVWAPRGKQAFWLQGKAPCAPCKPTTLLTCDDQQCLDSIQVEDVMAFLIEKNISKRAVDATKRKQVYPQQQGEKGMARTTSVTY